MLCYIQCVHEDQTSVFLANREARVLWWAFHQSDGLNHYPAADAESLCLWCSAYFIHVHQHSWTGWTKLIRIPKQLIKPSRRCLNDRLCSVLSLRLELAYFTFTFCASWEAVLVYNSWMRMNIQSIIISTVFIIIIINYSKKKIVTM